jgi:hypothetical protein
LVIQQRRGIAGAVRCLRSPSHSTRFQTCFL